MQMFARWWPSLMAETLGKGLLSVAHSTVDRPDSSDRQRDVTPSFLPSPLVLCLVFQTVQFSTSQSVRSIKNKHLTEAGDNSLALPGLPGELLTLSEV